MGRTSKNTRRELLGRTARGGAAALVLGRLAEAREAFREALEQEPASLADHRQAYDLAEGLTYLNHASIGCVPRVVRESQQEYLRLLEGNPWLHVWGGAWDERVEATRSNAARLLGCSSKELALTHNTTEAFNLLAHGLGLGPGDEVLFSSLNHTGASRAFEYAAEACGYSVRRFEFPLSETPGLTGEDVVRLHAEALGEHTRLLVLPHVDNRVGLRHPLEELAKMAHARGVDYVAVDGAQAAGMFPVNLADIGVDFYATSGHKWLQAPKGLGLFYVREDHLEHLRPMWVTCWTRSLEGHGPRLRGLRDARPRRSPGPGRCPGLPRPRPERGSRGPSSCPAHPLPLPGGGLPPADLAVSAGMEFRGGPVRRRLRGPPRLRSRPQPVRTRGVRGATLRPGGAGIDPPLPQPSQRFLGPGSAPGGSGSTTRLILDTSWDWVAVGESSEDGSAKDSRQALKPRNAQHAGRDVAPILPRVAAGDPGAVQEFIDRYGALVWSLVRKSIRDHAQAEDAVQEIFIAIWRAAAKYDPDISSEAVFLTTIARRRLIDRFRSRMSRPELENVDEILLAEHDEGLSEVELADEAQMATQALHRLKPQQRKLIEMWVMGGMTHTEIATSTNMPLGTVKSQIRRGLQRVRDIIGVNESAEVGA